MKGFSGKTLERMIKTRHEIALLKKSAFMADSCIPVIEDALRENKITEKEIARRIRKQLKSTGASQAFATLVASGRRAAQVHPRPYASKKRIAGLGYVDFGANYRGYRTDITVPFVKGYVGKRERKILKSTLKAYKAAVGCVKIGEYCCHAHRRAEAVLKRCGFDLPHAIGHGIGVKIHELPYIGSLNKKRMVRLSRKKKARALRRWEVLKEIRFQPGMVFTIEPAAYVRGVGGCRLENDFLMTRKGVRQLTHANVIVAD